MNVTKVLTKDYENMTLGERGKNKANSKPNKPNFPDDQMNVSGIITKDYENKSNWTLDENKPNTKPIQTQSNPISPPPAAKYTQYKPNQTQFQRQKMLPLMTINGRRAERLQFTGCGGRFLLTKQAFFYSIILLESNIYNRLWLFELSEKKPPISRKKLATEETDDIIGISKLKNSNAVWQGDFLGDSLMLNRKAITTILAVTVFAVSIGFGQGLEDNWNDFLHYTKIARFDLAKGYAQRVLDSSPDPVELLALSEANPEGYAILQRVVDVAPDAGLVEVSRKVLALIEDGKFIRRSDPKVIVGEIKRLSSGTERGWLIAVKRLSNAGEYAIPFMLDAIADDSREEEWEDIKLALPEIGRDAIRPLAAALQTENTTLKADIIKALGGIRYPQSLGYLKYIVEKDTSTDLRNHATQSIKQIDPKALTVPAAPLFYRLAEGYYYHAESLAPTEDAKFANIWFWDPVGQRLLREKVDRSYFNELMAMRACEWALKADAGFGWSIGLWQAAYFKAESAGIKMPNYFGPGHADAMTYATTAGPEYLHQALGRAIKDLNAYVALGAIEALATIAGERSLLFRIGAAQPLVHALSFNDKAVKYSAAIAIAAAGPKEKFPESKLVVANLAEALGETGENTDLDNEWVAEDYAVRAAKVMLKLVETRNRVIDLSAAQAAVIGATKDSRADIQMLAGRILAYLDSPDAQRAIAAMALDENNAIDVRISAFNSLAVSAKVNANLLDVAMIDAVYSLVSSQQADPELRSAAARAYGSLNLPSQKVKDLVLDQAKS